MFQDRYTRTGGGADGLPLVSRATWPQAEDPGTRRSYGLVKDPGARLERIYTAVAVLDKCILC
jgi:hypothetical protein